MQLTWARDYVKFVIFLGAAHINKARTGNDSVNI